MHKKGVIPTWFTESIHSRYEDFFFTVGGTQIHYRAWGEKGLPGLVLLHGGGAHMHWWSFLAPLLAVRYRVVTPDSRGMGDSEHSEVYRPDQLADDVIAVCDHAGLGERFTLVGHSFGGYVTLKTAVRHPDRVRGLVICDTPIRSADIPSVYGPRDAPPRSRRVYADFQEVAGRFRLIPEQPVANRYLVDYVTRHALRRAPGGWTWKADAKFFARLEFEEPNAWIPHIRCPAGIVYGEDSVLMTEPVLAYMKSVFPEGTPTVGVPDAYHHLMFDQPLALVEVLREIIGAWYDFQ